MNPLAINRYGTAEQQCTDKARYPRKLAHIIARRYGLTVYRCKLDRRHESEAQPMNEHDTTNRDRVIRLNIRGGARPETLAEFYGLSVDAVLRIARDDRPQTPRKAYTAEEAIQLARANALNERALHELRFELVRLQVGVETLAEENRVLKLANATLARRLDTALGPAWERREGERE